MNSMIAKIERLYIYPVKSMRGVEVSQAHVGLNGFYGDRRYAFVQRELAASDGFPWMTGREKPRMLLYVPTVDGTASPDYEPNVVVRTPEGEEIKAEDPRLCDRVSSELGQPVFLFKNDRGNFDSQHVSLFSLATLRALEAESGNSIDPRQFRANIYLEPVSPMPFAEEEWVGRTLHIGSQVVAGVTKKDSRCMMINIDPDSARQNPQVLRTVARNHNEQAGIYANVIVPGVIRVGEEIDLV